MQWATGAIPIGQPDPQVYIDCIYYINYINLKCLSRLPLLGGHISVVGLLVIVLTPLLTCQ